jgi:hypothetical protein
MCTSVQADTEIEYIDYILEASCQWGNLEENKVIAINSTTELNHHILNIAEEPPQIDFSRYTLLLASGHSASGISGIQKTLRLKEGIYILDVSIEINDAAVVESWVIAILTPKLANSVMVQLTVTEQPPCPKEIISPYDLSGSHLITKLNEVFSHVNAQGDSLLFVIQNAQEFSAVCTDPEVAAQIDFENYSIVWGKINSYSGSNRIASSELSVSLCATTVTYTYAITMDWCTACWMDIGIHYFWNIYPKLNNNEILLSIK